MYIYKYLLLPSIFIVVEVIKICFKSNFFFFFLVPYCFLINKSLKEEATPTSKAIKNLQPKADWTDARNYYLSFPQYGTIQNIF